MIDAFYHPDYAAPIGQHIMPIRKFSLVARAAEDIQNVRLETPFAVTEPDLLRVHSRAYINAVKTGEPRELAESQKFPWSPELFPSVCLTAGGCYAAAANALDTGAAAALVSGFHHAHADHGEGFCTFNGLIVSIDRLVAERRIRSAAILDMDLHYGNGTASLAVSRPHILALSIYGNDYVNNQAFKDVSQRHHLDGENHRSFALPAGSGRAEMMAALEQAHTLISQQPPGLLLYQAGADPYFEDPYSPLNLDHSDLLHRDRAVFEFAKREHIPVAWVLAGGYTQDVSKVVEVHVNTLRACADIFA